MSHTEGKLTLFSRNGTTAILDGAGKELVGWMGFDMSERSKREHKSNARRLVVCWNEHDGLVHDNAQLYQSLQAEMHGRLKAEKERDEALDVLRELAHGEYTDELGNRAVAILAKHQQGTDHAK